MKKFNTTAICIPSKHYMVDISDRVAEIKKMVDDGEYFAINRARQYGKTTTLNELKNALKSDYLVLSLSFEGLTDAGFKTEGEFIQTFSRLVLDQYEFFGVSIPDGIIQALEKLEKKDSEKLRMDELYRIFRRWIVKCEQPIVLLIDEVDKSTNNQVFIDFLGLLRDGYIARDAANAPAFQSVILAGVTDVRYIKNKIRDEADSKENSPWNIAADYAIDMSLLEAGIRDMLGEYEADHQTGMDTARLAKKIREYTNGYPFLVSRICEIIDTKVSKTKDMSEAWTDAGFEEAIRLLLTESNTLFQSITKNLNNYPHLKESIHSVLMEGTKFAYSSDQKEIVQMEMYGLIKNHKNTVRIANRIFETRLYNLFISDEELKNNAFTKAGDFARNRFVSDGKLNMCLIMERFIDTYTEVFGPLEEKFKEKDGRELFLLYLKPVINGTGNYYIEAQTRDQTRTDVVVDYMGEQYIIELKIWHGASRHEDGEKQISEYLDYFGLSTGYMLSFNFNQKKEQGVKQVHIGEKILYEGMV